jgi:hypothetical protein
LRIWRVQEIQWGRTCVSAYGREEDARLRVETALRHHILPSLETLASALGPRHQAFVEAVGARAAEIRSLLDAGATWVAAVRWRNFMEEWEEYNPQVPLWIEVGDVIVDWTERRDPREGPFRPVLHRRRRPPAMGADAERGRWRVWWADFGGRRHASMFWRERDALSHLARLLGELMERIERHATTFILMQDPRHQGYADAAMDTVRMVRSLLEHGKIMEAYVTYRRFEETFEGEWEGAFPLSMSFGAVRIERD